MSKNNESLKRNDYRILLEQDRDFFEKSRSELALHIHNSVSQQMTLLTMELALLQKRLGNDHPESAKLAETLALVSDLNETIRQITRELYPRSLEQLGLIPALEQECRRLSAKLNIQIRIIVKLQEVSASSSAGVQLFRLVQELINYIHQSHQPSEIVISIAKDHNSLRLELVGALSSLAVSIPKPDVPLLLVSARARAAALNATLSPIHDSDRTGWCLLYQFHNSTR